MGGGFAGALIAKKLEHDFEVTLVDSKIYFEYTPGILRTIIEPGHLKKIQILHKDYLKKAKIVLGKVNSIDREKVYIGNREIKFDYLAVCSGSSYNPPIKEQNIIMAARSRSLLMANKKLLKSKKILIIGGGLVGIELAAEISTNFKDKDVLIVNSRQRLVHRSNAKTSKYIEEFLKNRGVRILLNEKVEGIKNSRHFITRGGNKIEVDMAFISTGVEPNFEFMKKNFSKNLNDKGYVKVNSFLQLNGIKNIFAAGDIIDVKEEKTAQNAERHAEIIVHNLRALELGGKLKEYKVKKIPFVISLGKYNGIFEYGNFVFAGKVPALIKWLIEKWTMVKYGRLF